MSAWAAGLRPGVAFREVLRAVRGSEKLAAGVVTMALALALVEGGAVSLVFPLLGSFQAAAATPPALAHLRALALGMGGLVFLRGGLGYAHQMLSTRLQMRVLISLREAMIETLYRRRPEDIRALGEGRLVNLFSVQTERIVAALGGVVALFTAALLFGVYATAALVLSWRLAFAALALAALSFVLTRRISDRIRARSIGMTAAEEESTRLILDDLTGLPVLHAYDAGAERLARHRAVNRWMFRETMGLHAWRAALGPLTEVLYTVAVVAALLAALAITGERVLSSLPLVVTFGVVLRRLQTQTADLSEGWSGLAEQEGPAVNVHVLMDEPEPQTAAATIEPPTPITRIEIQGLTFAYRPAVPVLAGLDLELRRGEITALVGESGSGKSTLVQLLARLRTPDAGRILLDGVALDAAARSTLARRLGVVLEGAFVFDESLWWNVALGRPLPAEQVAEAVRVTGVDSLIDAFKGHSGERLGPGGRLLSGGQRQRVALARALAGAPEILILDEATSALDAESEQAVLEPLRVLRSDRITLVIAHRLSTVLAADRIVVLDGGQIVAEGQHAGLLETNGVYRRLVETQLIEGSGVGDHRSGFRALAPSP